MNQFASPKTAKERDVDTDEQKSVEFEDESAQPVDEFDIEELKKAIADEHDRAQTYLANWQRTQADLDNYRRRAEQERKDFTMFADSSLIKKVLKFLKPVK